MAKISNILLKRNDDYGHLGDLVLFGSRMKNIQHFIIKYIDWCGNFCRDHLSEWRPSFLILFCKYSFKWRIVSFNRCFSPFSWIIIWCFFFHQCVALQQLCFEWKPLILRETQIRNDLILLVMDWWDCINTGITLTRKVLLPYCHHWVCHLGFEVS